MSFIRYSGLELKLIREGSPQSGGRWLQVLSLTSTNKKRYFLSFTLHVLAAAQSATAQSSTWDSKLTFQQSLPDSEIQMERWRTSFKQSQDDKINALKVLKVGG